MTSNDDQTVTDLYAALDASGAEIDSHESDLYVKATSEALAIVRRSLRRDWSIFISPVDGQAWIEIPFGYTPWWEAKAAAGVRMAGRAVARVALAGGGA